MRYTENFIASIWAKDHSLDRQAGYDIFNTNYASMTEGSVWSRDLAEIS